eukprot:TRINITY_DN65216_c0_g1_i1.p1 TRINITY_DN65216_c0_g1~~TRINITY_DN65216_c0_g1_i1.p1  ORF type:complete len:508 (+),score=58.30 TRINITY_DN65216_c0_g1_i1:67-1590(+)
MESPRRLGASRGLGPENWIKMCKIQERLDNMDEHVSDVLSVTGIEASVERANEKPCEPLGSTSQANAAVTEKMTEPLGSSSQASTGAFSSLFCMFVLILLVNCVMVTIPLLIPLSDASLNVPGNLPYFLLYNPYVGSALGVATWERLRVLFNRETEPVVNVPFALATLRGHLIFGVAGFVCTALFILCSLPFGENLENSYVMLYIAPASTALFDFSFPLFLPKSERCRKVFMVINEYNGICNMPIFVLIGCVALNGYLQSLNWPALIKSAIVPALLSLLRLLIATVGRARINGGWEKLGYPKRFDECGVSFHINGLFEFSRLMLLPAASSVWSVISILVGECINVFTSIIILRRRFSADAAIQGRELSVRSHVYLRVQYHLLALVTPPMFIVAFTTLIRGFNTRQYFLYECFLEPGFDGDGRAISVYTYAIVMWVVRGCLLIVEFVVLQRVNALAFVADALTFFLRRRPQLICTSTCFIGMLFTSCWLIKHDGIGALAYITDCSGPV